MRRDLDAPWLEWRARKDGTRTAYWRCRIPGYPIKTARLWHGVEPTEAEMVEIAADCRRLYAEAREWASDEKSEPTFDGTLGGLIRRYQADPDSPFREVKYTTRSSYEVWLRMLDKAAGHNKLAAWQGRHFRELYKLLKQPKVLGGTERLRRATGGMQMLRVLLLYGMTLGFPECTRLRLVIERMRFKDMPPRQARMSLEQVTAFIAKAHEMGRPELALGQALQFELTLRQRDVIGEWFPEPEGERWSNGLTWNDISPSMVLTKTTTKTGAVAEFDLKLYPLAMAEIERIPRDKRVGPMVINPTTGMPYKRLAFGRRWREIANAAGIPKNVWNMDSRAGGITEGSDAGADIEHLRHHATHSHAAVTERYSRQTLDKTRTVAQLRVAHRRNRD